MLQLSGISKRYAGRLQALDNVHLSIPNGMFGLLGPNGAGKSTLMRTLATLQDPDSGTIMFDGIDLLKEKYALRQMLGYLPQHFGAYPRVSAAAMLRHFAALKGIHGRYREQEVERVLIQTNLWEVKNRSIETFSGGMKQRYGIAQALLGQPKLIIVDEPTAGLDPAERRRFQNLLAGLERDVIVLLSTHIVDDVEDLCPNVAIMGHGRILKTGRSVDLTESLRRTLWTLSTTRENLEEIRTHYRVISSRVKPGGLQVKLLAQIPPEGATSAQPTLEDVYFATLFENNLLTELE